MAVTLTRNRVFVTADQKNLPLQLHVNLPMSQIRTIFIFAAASLAVCKHCQLNAACTLVVTAVDSNSMDASCTYLGPGVGRAASSPLPA